MGEGILKYYQTNIKKEYKIAFLSTFFITLLIHLYKFTNTLPNHDSVYNYYTDQNILDLGRWALSTACGISSYWDLPWINGMFSCVFIALTVVMVVALLKIENPILIGLAGALIAASPATTETFFFLYTADGYMIAMFLAAMAVYLSRIEETRISRFVLGGICICISCGIYQAYVSFALVLSVCYFVDVLLLNNHSSQNCFKWIFRQAVIYVTALTSYYVIWKLCMRISDTVARDYQGVSDVGNISVGVLLKGLISSIKTTMLYFLQWDVFENGFTLYSVLSCLFIIIMVVGLLISCYRSKILKRKWASVLFVLCLVAIIPFACIWHFASDSVGYRAMMLQSFSLLFILTALLYERWFKTIAKNIVCLFLIVIIFNNALMANISYFYMNLCYERTYAEGVEMMMEIHDLQDCYEINDIAIIGDRLPDVQWDIFDSETGKIAPAGKIHMLETSLHINSGHTIAFLRETFGMELETVGYTRLTELTESDEVQSMGVWPAGDSITVIDHTIVIKLANEAE